MKWPLYLLHSHYIHKMFAKVTLDFTMLRISLKQLSILQPSFTLVFQDKKLCVIYFSFTVYFQSKWQQDRSSSQEVFHHISLLTLDSMMQCLFGYHSNCQNEKYVIENTCNVPSKALYLITVRFTVKGNE